jgi:hypothetical protein
MVRVMALSLSLKLKSLSDLQLKHGSLWTYLRERERNRINEIDDFSPPYFYKV